MAGSLKSIPRFVTSVASTHHSASGEQIPPHAVSDCYYRSWCGITQSSKWLSRHVIKLLYWSEAFDRLNRRSTGWPKHANVPSAANRFYREKRPLAVYSARHKNPLIRNWTTCPLLYTPELFIDVRRYSLDVLSIRGALRLLSFRDFHKVSSGICFIRFAASSLALHCTHAIIERVPCKSKMPIESTILVRPENRTDWVWEHVHHCLY